MEYLIFPEIPNPLNRPAYMLWTMTTGCGNSLLSSLLTAAQSFYNYPFLKRLHSKSAGRPQTRRHFESGDFGHKIRRPNNTKRWKKPYFFRKFPLSNPADYGRIILLLVEARICRIAPTPIRQYALFFLIFVPTTGLGYLAFSPPSDPVLFFSAPKWPFSRLFSINPMSRSRSMFEIYEEISQGIDWVVVNAVFEG